MSETDAERGRDDADPYEIRRFEPGDAEPCRRLYETVFGADPGAEWFEWKYGSNPYVSEPAVFLAVHDGEVVGARPFFALRMATGESTPLALQPADTMVHPDHRKRGLFTRMTEAALSHYEDREPAFCFNFPNHNSKPGYLKLGWEAVDEVTSHYRVHDPTALVDAVPEPLAPAVRAASRVYHGASDTLRSSPDLPVEHHATPPVEALATLSRRCSRDGIHAHRDERFYRWRLAAPGRRYEAFLARRGGDPAAALVVSSETRDGVTTARLLDALAVGDTEARHEAYAALLSAVVERRDDADVLAARGGVPPAVLRRFGFVADTSLPLSPVASTTTMVARPVGEGPWTVDDTDLRDADNWSLTFGELDSA